MSLTRQLFLASLALFAAGTSPLLAQDSQPGTESKAVASRSYYSDLVLDPALNMRSGAASMAGSMRGYYHFAGLSLPAQAFAELGYKSKGYIEGYALNASMVFSFGVGIEL